MTFQGNRDRIRECFSDVHVYMPYTVFNMQETEHRCC